MDIEQVIMRLFIDKSVVLEREQVMERLAPEHAYFYEPEEYMTVISLALGRLVLDAKLDMIGSECREYLYKRSVF